MLEVHFHFPVFLASLVFFLALCTYLYLHTKYIPIGSSNSQMPRDGSDLIIAFVLQLPGMYLLSGL